MIPWIPFFSVYQSADDLDTIRVQQVIGDDTTPFFVFAPRTLHLLSWGDI
jgi:hypothetical protein